MHGLVHAAGFAILIRTAKAGRRQHTQRAGEHRRNVAEHIAEQVVGDDHVELLGLADQLHAAVVG